MSDYDIITIGGGLGGAALARSMAEDGSRVLIVERETKFKDRVRGEGMTSWGCGEARSLGIYDLLLGSCGHEIPWWDNYLGPMQVAHRKMASTTPQGLPTLTFYHPEMQQTLLDAARDAGADVRRGAKVTGVTPGKTPQVTVENADGTRQDLSARIVVGADGRGSLVRKWAGFTEQKDNDRLLISGLLFDDSAAPQDTVRLVNDLATGRGAILFPQGGARVRTYFICSASDGLRLQGDKDVQRFVDEAVAAGMPREYFDGARATGPLATFDGADSWVNHPYRDGVALIGDAATSSDPSWGQGLSLTVRDARVLRDALRNDKDWDAAGRRYAEEHDRYYGVLRTVEDWFTQFFFETGPVADARRAKAFPLIAQDPTRMPDALFSGPDHAVDDAVRQKFFAEVE
jgi:2-polyprenyl-6-methoxyphenol hydroxylase-like FAD-dependent oxidoreductase